MKTTILLSLVVLLLAVMNQNSVSAEASKSSKLQHVVSFKFKSSASQAEIDALVKAFVLLPKKIKEIKKFEWGTNVSPESHAKGFTHCFVATFHNSEDRDVYLAHPDHKEFGKMVANIVDDVFVIDFWAQESF